MLQFNVIIRWFTRKLRFNYYYFGLFFLLLLSINLIGILTIDKGSYWVKGFFILYNIGQLVIELIGVVLVSIILKRYVHKWLYYCYIGVLFVFLLVQFVEAALIKLMDVSMLEALHIAFGADMKNFFELLRLSDVGIGVWLGLLILAIILPFLGIFFYQILEKRSKQGKLVFRLDATLGILSAIPIILSCTDSCVFKNLSYREYSAYKKSLPWKGTFFKVPIERLELKAPLKAPRNDPALLDELSNYKTRVSKKPNVYLFVVESLRSDYLNDTTAPHLMAFKAANIAPTTTVANANHTITSWFSIFHSAYPFYWAYSQNKTFQEGSLPLHILKQMGYKIHVYSSAQLKYYDFDQVLLGKDHCLADTFKLAPHYGSISSSDADTEIMNAFEDDFQYHSREGNVYIFFLDSTHFNYSWPKNFPQKFTPVGEVTWKHRLSSDLSALKNRYKNSIAFVDHLFNQTVTALKKRNLYEESVIVVCGDHGEEFKEEGKLFHASHLSSMQTHIPLFYKLGARKKQVNISSHIDIFPSIIDYIDRNHRFLTHLDGSSILSADRSPFAVTTRYNSCAHPYEFSLCTEQRSILLRFDHKNNIFQSTVLHILDVYSKGNLTPLSKEEISQQFQPSLDSLFPVKGKTH
jgi:hypothetical protein